MAATDAQRLVNLIRAQHPAIGIVTHEQEDALRVVREAAEGLGAQVFVWSILDGVRDGFSAAHPVEDTGQAAAALYWLGQHRLPALIVLVDINAHLGDPHTLAAFRRLLATAAEVDSTVITIDHSEAGRPEVIAAVSTRFDVTLPQDEEIEAIVKTTLRTLHRARPIEIEISQADYRMIIKNLRGLSRRQAAQVVRDVVAEDRRLDAADLNAILARKRQLVGGGGTLEYVESPASLESVGGLDRLKAWLAARARSFDEEAAAFGLKPPRGVLLLGVQGAGKSLCAKAIATAWQRPLLRLDPGSLYDRFVGESERRLRDALRQAEAMAPIVLWIDEIEKGFASAAAQSTDGGLSQRMFGALLTWMNDHEAPVFMVATANNIEALPPELLRKGRFDEIFFVDLPGEAARRRIFEIHLRKRQRDPAAFDIARLASAAAGFSGAEIEQAVLAAMHEAYSGGREVTTGLVLTALANTSPLSVTMAEDIAALRAWAEGRCVPAEGPESG